MLKRVAQIIAIGGGGLLKEPDDLLLDRYVLAQARKRTPAICFLPTASGDQESYLARFYAAMRKHRCRPTHVPLFGRTPDLKRALLTQDVIYVGGGNTKSMLATWRDWGLPRLLRRAWRDGIVLAGVSAGAICWFETGVTDSWAERLYPLPCLGILPGTCCPHYDSEPERRPTVRRLVASGSVAATLALDDGAAAHFVGRKLMQVVISRPKARAHIVRRVGRDCVETSLPFARLRRGRTPSNQNV